MGARTTLYQYLQLNHYQNSTLSVGFKIFTCELISDHMESYSSCEEDYQQNPGKTHIRLTENGVTIETSYTSVPERPTDRYVVQHLMERLLLEVILLQGSSLPHSLKPQRSGPRTQENDHPTLDSE